MRQEFLRARGPLVTEFIAEFTYAGLFLALFGAGLGLPVPEELPILTAGVLAHEEVITWWVALPVCIVGVVSGDLVLYWVGFHWGERILGWWPVRRVLRPEREERLKAAYRRHGVKIVFTARHVMGLRAAAFLTAGIAHVPFWRFVTVDGLASLVGVPIGFSLAFLFTGQLERVMRDVHRAEHWLMLLALAGAAVWIAWAAFRKAQHDVAAPTSAPPRRML